MSYIIVALTGAGLFVACWAAINGLIPQMRPEADLERAFRNAAPVSTPSHGPFPPFDLGGSLERNDYLDFVGDFHGNGRTRPWTNVRRSRDVTIDWDDLKRAPLVAEVTVLGGICQVGIQDTSSEAVVVESPLTGVRRGIDGWNERAEVQLPLPAADGTRTYRLVVRPSPGGNANTFWVAGRIDFPSYSFAGNEDEWRTVLEDEPPVWRVPRSAHDVDIDWNVVRDPINVVLAEIAVFVYDPRHHEASRPAATGAVRIVDVSDGVSVAESDPVLANYRQGMGGRFPGAATVKLQLPRAVGRKRYRLYVRPSEPGIGIAAKGRLILRH